MEITRRTILGASAAASAAALTPQFAAATTTDGPSAADWADLDRSLTGSLALPGATTYTSRKALFNPRWDSRRPAAVARVLSTRDIANCIDFARTTGSR